jgi:hypothetical protein
VAAAGDYVYIAADDAGLYIVDVSNPISPTLTDIYTALESTQGVAVAGDYAYLVGDSGSDSESGLHVVNISNPANPTLAGYYYTLAEAHAVAVAGSGTEAYIYVADSSGGLAILRVRYRLYLPLVLR